VPFGARTLWVTTQNEVKMTGGGQDIELTTNAGKTWKNVTPPGLNVDGGNHWINGFFALSPTRAWLVYGGVDKGPQTIETTVDAGRHWSSKGFGVLPRTDCSLQFVSLTDGTCTVYAGAAGSMGIAVYRTSDAGQHWSHIFSSYMTQASLNEKAPAGSLPFECDKSLHFESAIKGYALFYCNGGTGAIIYGTTNGGVTWTARNVVQPRLTVGGGGFTGPPVFSGAKGAVPYAGGSYSAVFVTNNGGESFHPVYPPGKPRTWAVDLVSPTQWRLTNGKEILATNNAGTSWFSIVSNTVLQNSSYVKGESPGGLVDFVSADDGWLTENQYDANSRLLRSTDEGRLWRKVGVPGTKRL
jgi:photosystem II stability/assembly factor-like uncharacterized protein